MASGRAAAKQEQPAATEARMKARRSPESAPRPPGAEDIARMLADADEAAAASRRAPRQSASLTQRVTLVALCGGLAVGLAALAYFGLASLGVGGGRLSLAVAGVLVFALAAAAAFSGLAGAARAVRSGASDRRDLAGVDMLSALGLAGAVLDADGEARLVTRRDGVVVYANAAYHRLADEAGVSGAAGLPPRIDRLFSQQGGEATKVFRLCRAAKSAAAAEETIQQVFAIDEGGWRRRFDVSVKPAPDMGEYAVWRIRELPIEEERQDALAAAYADYVRPVCALERSGQIAWCNAAMRARLGAERGALAHIDDVVLGETADLVRQLWQVDQAPQKARVRRRGDDPADASLTAFRRGGVGEGFVCLEVDIAEPRAEDESAAVTGDMTESPFGVAVIEGDIGREARIVEANKAFTDVFGGVKKNAPLARALPPEALEELAAETRRKAASGGAPRPVEATIGEGANARTFAIYARPARRRRGGYGVRRTLLYSADISDRKRLQEDHALDQKLKAVGRLTGEIAHDFNNLLQVVLGNCERLMLRHPAGDPAYRDLVLIRENAQRAANMTKQLLAFSRKQTLKREVVSITELLRDFTRFLNRAVGEKVTIDLINGRGLPNVRIDRNQFESAIMNLAVNARDAMAPEGGRLTIRTSAVLAEEIRRLGVPDIAAQDHLLIEVSDTGPGVPKEILDKIFDPFFTTKDVGKGTGLGLSTVYGIIGQMEGAITVGDAPGGGALFSIYLPAHQGEPEPEETPASPSPHADLTGAGRILVVEDEDAVRTFVVSVLEDCGYEVTAVADGEEALETLGEDAGGFDLIISDVMMPEIDGPTMVRRAREELGVAAKVIFMSAYAENAVREDLDEAKDAQYIQKPFTLKGLAAKVKEILSPPVEPV